MSDRSRKVLDNRMRRVAERRGLTLRRSRRRDVRALDYGVYTLTDGNGVEIVFGDLDQIKRYLDE